MALFAPYFYRQVAELHPRVDPEMGESVPGVLEDAVIGGVWADFVNDARGGVPDSDARLELSRSNRFESSQAF